MKKSIAACLLSLVACSALVDTAAAAEDGSLLFQNSFGLYYLEDPFDLTLNPAFLSQIDRWRLFTNLSNYEDANSYLIGTSGRLGPGSLGLFYQMDEERFKEESTRSSDQATEIPPSIGPAGNLSRYAHAEAESSMEKFEQESDRQSFIVSYGMDFGSFTLGASYRPSFSNESTTLTGSIGDFGDWPDFTENPQWWDPPNFAGDLEAGENYSRAWRETRYGQDNPNAFHDWAENEGFQGSAEADEDRHGFELGSQLRFWKSLPVWVRLGAQSVKRTVSGSGTYTSSRAETQQGEENYSMWEDGYRDSESQTSTWSGDPVRDPRFHAFDGTEWSLEIVPRYAVSTAVTLELQLGYTAMQGDVAGQWTQDVAIDRSLRYSADERTETWHGSQHIANSFSGDSDVNGYSVAPRVYLTYKAVEFALGVDYSRSEDEVTGSQRGEGTLSWSYDNGSGSADAGDWTYAGNSTSRSDRSFEFTTTVVSLPVATKFKVTEKLELRAGAEFVRTDTETKNSDSTRDDEQFTITDGRGNVVRQGPSTQGSDARDSLEETVNTTSYRLGAGYRATENLQFDLLFSQSKGGGVDTTVVYASAVFAF